MNLKSSFIFLAVLFFSLHEGVYGIDCAPDPVQFLIINTTAVLLWKPYPEDPCVITQYDIDVTDDSSAYHFEVTDTYLDLSFLEVCTLWNFTVTPISNGAIGFARSLIDYIPVPPDADLSLNYFNVNHLEGREILFDYALTSNTYGNCTVGYLLTVLDKELNTTQNVHIVEYPYITDSLSPCVPYQFTLRAYNSIEDRLEGAPLEWSDFKIDPQSQTSPTINSVESKATSFKMNLKIEGSTNRCPLKAIYVDGGTYFNLTVPVENSMDWEYLVDVEVTSLSPSSMYYFKVTVENSGGLSPAIQLSAQTLQSD